MLSADGKHRKGKEEVERGQKVAEAKEDAESAPDFRKLPPQIGFQKKKWSTETQHIYMVSLCMLFLIRYLFDSFQQVNHFIILDSFTWIPFNRFESYLAQIEKHGFFVYINFILSTRHYNLKLKSVSLSETLMTVTLY